MNKFLGYFNLYDIRPTTAQYLWTYLLMKDKLAHNGIFLINEDYLNFRVFYKGNELEIAKYNRKMWLDNV